MTHRCLTRFDTDTQGAHPAPCSLCQGTEERKGNGNDDTERKAEDAHSDCAEQRPQVAGMERQAEKDSLTDSPAGWHCNPAERIYYAAKVKANDSR